MDRLWRHEKEEIEAAGHVLTKSQQAGLAEHSWTIPNLHLVQQKG